MTNTPITNPGATIGFIAKRTDAALEDQQHQIDALERLVLNRAALVGVEQDGRKVNLMFTRRGAVHQFIFYADMSCDVPGMRKALLDD